MSEPGAIDDIRAACVRIEEEIPLSVLAVVRERVDVALDQMRAAGSSRHPDYVGAISELERLLAEVDTAHADLIAAADHARIYRERLG